MTAPQVRTRVTKDRALELPRCALVVLDGKDRGRERIITGDVFRVGKSKENDLEIVDETVSRNHFEIVREPRGYLLRDLGSTNGTFLDGAEIKEAYLKPGAVITAGIVQLKVRTFAERIEILPSEKERFGGAVGRSVAMREIFGLLERIAPTDATVLLGGETGTGKDVLARAIHDASHRKDRPFVVVDCGAVTGTLIESELFGHERGSFTGAHNTRQGAFELAHGGTLFLDEIGELAVDLQPKLLRVLEAREIRRVGGNKTIRVDIRVIAASKRNLRFELERGKFREDLYFRLAVVPIEVPPLRQRREDTQLLVEHFLRDSGGGALTVSPETMEALKAHDWPGNVRELRNVLERATYLARAAGFTEVRLTDMPFVAAPSEGGAGAAPPTFEEGKSYRENRQRWEDEFERRYVRWLLKRTGGNISAAAREADMDRKYLHKLVRKHGIDPDAPEPDDES